MNPPNTDTRAPIALLVDDGAPLVHVYREHWVDVHREPPLTRDGRPLLEVIPNEFLERYCDVMERHGIKGKFSIVPAPSLKGDVVRGIAGFDPALTQQWLDTVKRRLGPLCDFCPEGITHNLAVDLQTGKLLAESETAWSQHQNRETLTTYLVRELTLLKEAGIDATGVTSPWVFGIEVEPEYQAAIVEAQRAVYGRDFSWYFLHMIYGDEWRLPWVAVQEAPATLVSIPATVSDVWWDTIDSPRTDAGWIGSLADRLLTEDGAGGEIANILAAGGWPILLTHWQSLFSNGLETGLAVLDELGRRVSATLSDRVRWMTCSEIARRTAARAPQGRIWSK